MKTEEKRAKEPKRAVMGNGRERGPTSNAAERAGGRLRRRTCLRTRVRLFTHFDTRTSHSTTPVATRIEEQQSWPWLWRPKTARLPRDPVGLHVYARGLYNLALVYNLKISRGPTRSERPGETVLSTVTLQLYGMSCCCRMSGGTSQRSTQGRLTGSMRTQGTLACLALDRPRSLADIIRRDRDSS